MFKAGSKVTKAVDAYDTSKRAYAGLPREAVIERVYKTGMRPRFPSTAPAQFVSLAEACWQTDPARRPSFNEISERLEQLAAELVPSVEADGLLAQPPQPPQPPPLPPVHSPAVVRFAASVQH